MSWNLAYDVISSAMIWMLIICMIALYGINKHEERVAKEMAKAQREAELDAMIEAWEQEAKAKGLIK